MRRLLKWTGIVFGVVTLGIVVLVAVWDWNWFRGYANRAGSDATGREFAIAGPIDVDLGWVTRVRLERVQLGNAEWAKEPRMVEIALVDFDIDLGELIGGRVSLPNLLLKEPKIRLERRADGEPNWNISRASSGGVAVEAAAPDDRTEFPVIGRLRIENGTLSYDAPADQIALEAQISTATGEGGEGRETVRLAGKGKFAKEPFELQLVAGSLLSLREGDRPYPAEVHARIGKTAIDAEGSAADPIKMQGLDFKLSVKGANMADLFPIFHIPLPKTPPYSLSGRLTNEDDVWHFRQFAGRMGDSDLSGDLSYQAREERPFIRADLVSNKLDFDDLAGLVGAEPEAKGKKPARTKTKDPGRVLPDEAVDLSRLRAADMDVRFKGKRIRHPGLPIQSMDARFRLENGRLTVEPLSFGIANGSASGSLVLDGRKSVPHVATNLALRRLELRSFVAGTDKAGLTAGRFGGRVELAGSGRSVADILATADGKIGLSMAGGRLSQLIIELAGIDVAEGLAFLFGKDKSVPVRCIVGDFAAQNGVLQSRALVIDTTDTLVDGKATIDLRNEALDIRMLAHPKDPSPFAGRTPVTVTGSFADPRIGVDPSGLAARGAVAVALGAILTPIAAIIPFIELGLGEDSDCNGLIAQASQKQRQK